MSVGSRAFSSKPSPNLSDGSNMHLTATPRPLSQTFISRGDWRFPDRFHCLIQIQLSHSWRNVLAENCSDMTLSSGRIRSKME